MVKKITITIKEDGGSNISSEGLSNMEVLGILRFHEKALFVVTFNAHVAATKNVKKKQ